MTWHFHASFFQLTTRNFSRCYTSIGCFHLLLTSLLTVSGTQAGGSGDCSIRLAALGSRSQIFLEITMLVSAVASALFIPPVTSNTTQPLAQTTPPTTSSPSTSSPSASATGHDRASHRSSVEASGCHTRSSSSWQWRPHLFAQRYAKFLRYLRDVELHQRNGVVTLRRCHCVPETSGSSRRNVRVHRATNDRNPPPRHARCPEVGQQALNLAHSLYLIGQHSPNEAAFCRMRST
jgi:hypothetical protein